jgi:lysophospholipase L1-like esterase
MAQGLGRKLLYSLIPLVVLFGGAELGLRGAGWPTVEGTFAHNQPYWVLDPELKGQATPHREENTTFPVSTDSNGLRAPLHSVEKPDGVWRIMTLGCSTTFGWGVADDQSYPAQLERLAQQQRPGRVEVINGGQPGYTSFQGRWLWERSLRAYHPDVVLIGYIVQDARDAAYSDEAQAILQQDARFLKDQLLYRFRTYLALRSALGHVQIRAKERQEGGGGQQRVPPADYVANLRWLVAQVRVSGATPVLFGYPLEREGYTSAHRRILKAAAEELGVPHFDPQPQMEQASSAAPLYFPHDKGHANADGNAMIAQWVHRFLEKSQLLGPA